MGTRGVGYIFVEGINEIVLYSSTEFNGDMDLECYGYEFLERLSRVQNTRDFVKEMREFNEGHFDYTEDMMYREYSQKANQRDWQGNLDYGYIEQSSIHFKLFERSNNYLEDYSYIKNLTKQTLMIGCKNGVVLLKPNQTMVCNFGRFMQNADGLEELEIIEWTGEKAECEEEKEYTVKIEETRTYIIRVQAKSEEEAEELAKSELECGNFDEEWESEHEMYCYVEEVKY